MQMGDSMFEAYERIIIDFLWEGKKAKIPLSVLYCDQSKGGLKLCNIKLKHTSLLCKWVVACFDSEEIANLSKINLNTFNNEVWSYNLNRRDFKKYVCRGLNNFWDTVCLAWSQVNFRDPIGRLQILDESVCMNSWIRINKEPIPPKTRWPQKIRDIVDENGEFIDFQQIRTQYVGLSWLDYLGIQSAIPADWKQVLKTQRKDDLPATDWILKLCHKNAKVSRICYRLLNTSNDACTRSYNLWAEKIELRDVREISDCFRYIYKITNVSKLRSFQYRLLHNKIFCNDVLFHWKKYPDQQCDYCDKKQTPIHLFFECETTQNIWTQVQDFLDDHGYNVLFTVKNIILNNYGDQLVDFIILVAKQVIFRCKCQKIKPSWQIIMKEIELLYRIELYNATVSQTLAKHCNKWRFIKPECTHIPIT